MAKVISIIRKHPLQSLAISYISSNDSFIHLDYQTLLQKVDFFCQHLEKIGVRKDDFVAIKLEQADLVIAVLAVLKLGSIYVPFAQNLPPAWAHWVLTSFLDKETDKIQGFTKSEVATVIEHEIYFWKCSNKVATQEESGIAYIVHTSGSTREQAMAVRVSTEALISNLSSFRELLNFQRVVGALTTKITFDPSIIELFLPLFTGGHLFLAPEKLLQRPDFVYERLLKEANVEILFMTPSSFSRFSKDQRSSILSKNGIKLKHLFLGGEAFPQSVLNMLRSIWSTSPPSSVTTWNIYGITEHSVWASAYKLTSEHLPIYTKYGVPIACSGSFLKDVSYEIIFDNDDAKEGNLYLGGEKRICLIGHESFQNYQKMRCTGDRVRVCKFDHYKEMIFFAGRSDSLIKIFGRRVDLSELDRSFCQAEGVIDCCVISHEQVEAQAQLIAFIQTDLSDIKDLEKGLKEISLPDYARPARFIFLKSFPLSNHGKIDKKALLHSINTISLPPESVNVVDLVKEVVSVAELKLEQNFFEIGGNSIKAAIIVGRLLQGHNSKIVEAVYPRLLTAIFHLPLGEFIKVWESTDFNTASVKDITVSIEHDNVFLKRQYKLTESWQRGGKLTKWIEPKLHHHQQQPEKLRQPKEPIVWKVYFKKCIDASPLLGVFSSSLDTVAVVFIGSHAGIFKAINMQNGTTIWETLLPERIEASANFDESGRFVLIGTYGGMFYALSVFDGTICAVFKTKSHLADFKATPVIPPWSGGVIWIGGYDGNLYALFLSAKEKSFELTWEYQCDGAIFASCEVHPTKRRIFAVTIKGTLYQFQPLCGEGVGLVWKKNFGAAIFSTPVVVKDLIISASVAGIVYAIDVEQGFEVWRREVNAPIFSTPCLTFHLDDKEEEDMLVFGTHKGKMVCLDLKGSLIREISMGEGVIFSTPFPIKRTYERIEEKRRKLQQQQQLQVICSISNHRMIQVTLLSPSTSGVEERDAICVEFKLRGEIFSSPLVFQDRWIIVGCRDDYLYMFDRFAAFSD